LRNAKLLDRLLQRSEQSIGVRSWAERDPHTSFATVIARSIPHQNAAPSHVLYKR
jgi:hypothetical protein